MKIKEIEIKNFRSIKSANLSGPTDDIWTFIGQNNAGKSSVIHAIRAFYADYNVTVEDFCRSCSSAPIEITLEYELHEEEFSQLPEFYKLPNNRLKVVKRFTKEKLKGEFHGFEIKGGIIKERESEFFGDKNVPVGKLGDIIYIPAVKDLSEELKKTKSSIFTKLISRILSEALVELDSWNDLVREVKKFTNDLKSPIKDSGEGNLKSVHEIEESLTEMLSSWRLRSQIDISPPTPEDIIISGSKLKLLSEDTGQEEDPLTLGSGAQRSIVNSLLLLWAQVESKKKKASKKIFSGDLTLLLYEEPESLLHYDQEKKLLKNLEEIAKSGSSQIFLCTHSPNLITTKSNALFSIFRYVKENTETEIFKASQNFLDQLKTEEDIFSFVLWLNPDRNTMFFVDKVILVEGSTDKVFLNYLIQNFNVDANVYIIDCGGKWNIPRFMSLCLEFGIKHSVLFDGDGDKNEEHKERNKEIFDDKNIFTIDIKKFPDTLERYVEFDEKERDKPLEILNQLKSGKLTEDKKKEFIDFIEK
ncbi:MAG: AAA family ATPase [Parcubacteria group bacterium]|jgi:predicted ATP-dependent endonuclease of OLD family